MIEAIGFLVGIGIFPCLVLGLIMLISFLTCDYIEKFVMKTFCSIKNRRRRYREQNTENWEKKRKKSSSGGESFRNQNSKSIMEEVGTGASSVETPRASAPRHPEEPPPSYFDGWPASAQSHPDQPPSYFESQSRRTKYE